MNSDLLFGRAGKGPGSCSDINKYILSIYIGQKIILACGETESGKACYYVIIIVSLRANKRLHLGHGSRISKV